MLLVTLSVWLESRGSPLSTNINVQNILVMPDLRGHPTQLQVLGVVWHAHVKKKTDTDSNKRLYEDFPNSYTEDKKIIMIFTRCINLEKNLLA